MTVRVSIEDCPGLCLSAGVDCAVEEVMSCPKRARLLNEMENRKALLEGVWVVEILGTV